jgi:1-acyl-sn-glycerol-3-phosphate acyltransferase
MSDRFGALGMTDNPGRPTKRVLAIVRSVFSPFVRAMFRPQIEGFSNLPDGPFLLVANHSGALGIAEILTFATLYLDKFGTDRPLAGFAHPFGFRIWPLKLLMRGLGAIPSTYEAAEATLALGVPLLVFPGGDYEATRPIWLANKVDFCGRRGFLKMARKANVPIVPMGFRGSHYTAPIVWQSTWLLPYLFVAPRLLGIKRYPVTLLAVMLAAAAIVWLPSLGLWRFLVAFLALSSPLALLPWVPWTIRGRIGKPISYEELFPTLQDDALGDALSRVEDAVRVLTKP